MSKGLKLSLGIFYIIILFLFLYLIFHHIDITRLDDFLYYKDLQTNLEKFISKNLYLNLLMFFAFCLTWVTLLGFGSPLLIMSGILFGKWTGTLISVLSISIGALFLYIIASFFFKNFLNKMLKKKFSNHIKLFQKNEFYYFFIFRLVGGLGIPFGLQNILPVVFNMKRFNYFFASFFGFIPIFFIWNTIGSGLDKYIRQSESFNLLNLIMSKEIYLPVIMFVIAMIFSTVIKKRVFDIKS
jgi:uncharacterized membrane protein YdjX (TVP38/TMEM64 family)